MTKYHIAFVRTEWSNHWVEADTPEEAEKKAWAELVDEHGDPNDGGGGDEWLIECVDEETP